LTRGAGRKPIAIDIQAFITATEEFALSYTTILTGSNRGKRVPLLEDWRLNKARVSDQYVTWSLRRDSSIVTVHVDVAKLAAVYTPRKDIEEYMAEYVVLKFQEFIAQFEASDVEHTLPPE
jgi:hypothetical protein